MLELTTTSDTVQLLHRAAIDHFAKQHMGKIAEACKATRPDAEPEAARWPGHCSRYECSGGVPDASSGHGMSH